jgi:hypothetical protein
MQRHMSLSGAGIQPSRSNPPDPLEEARRLLRSAARLPYSAKVPNAWAQRFRSQLTAARRALAAHTLRGERGASDDRAARDSRSLSAMHDAQAEHRVLLRRALDLALAAEKLDQPDIWRMVQLSEETMALAQAVERHANDAAESIASAAPRSAASIASAASRSAEGPREAELRTRKGGG